jgi:predicted O-methyltransferase YrrM
MNFPPRPQHMEARDPKFRQLQRQMTALWSMWAVVALVLWLAVGDMAFIAALIALGGLLIALALRLYHVAQVEAFYHYRASEALFGLYAVIQPRLPLPPMRLWVISPDFALLIVQTIRAYRPQVIVELGSGVSTLICGYCVEAQGSGQIISYEHEADFADVTRTNVRAHGLDGYAAVIHAPLTPLADLPTRRWYDPRAMADLPGIDLLIVDGPPEGINGMARYPALPSLINRLNPGALVLVDDFMRADEYAMVRQWVEAYDLDMIAAFANEKGAALLRRRVSTRPTKD